MKTIVDVIAVRIIEYWHRPLAGVAACIFTAISVGYLVSNAGERPPTWWGLGIIAAATGAVVFVWFATNKLPRVPRGMVGVVLAVTCEDDQHDRRVRSDFIQSLVRLLERDSEGARFFVVTLPPYLTKRITGFAHAERYLSRVRGHMILFGTVKKRQLRGKDVHVLHFDGLVRHAPVTASVHKELSSQFTAVVPRGWVLPTDADFFAFEATSEWTDVATRYVVGLAALASGDPAYAERLLLSVESAIRAGRPNLPPLQVIGQRLPSYLKLLYEAWLRLSANQYTMTRDVEHVRLMEQIADKLLARAPSAVNAYLTKAICSFLLRRDVRAARAEVYKAKQIGDVTWRYSLAFLDAYEGDLDNAEKEYMQAFKGRLQDITVPVQCEEFIQLVLQEEPNKAQLHYCAGLINYYAKGDMLAANQDFELFLREAELGRYPRQLQRAQDLCEESRHASTV